MTTATTDATVPVKPLRLWPGIALAAVVLVARYLLPLVWLDGLLYGLLTSFAAAVLVLVWWVTASRAPWQERVEAVALIALGFFATPPFLHASIRGGGMGNLFWVLALPALAITFVVWAVATRNLRRDGARRATMAAAMLATFGAFTLVRTGGNTSDFQNDFAWRWSPTHEEKLLAQAADEPVAVTTPLPAASPSDAPAPAASASPSPTPAPSSAPSAAPTSISLEQDTSAEWPGFRGADRTGIARGVRVATDWSAAPPVELWRRPVGPGWSSFAVDGDVIFTQEQRGEDEVVAAYSLQTGQPIWRHADRARFWESNAGAGPRGTPTLARGRVYTLGGTGLANAVDARTGAAIWTKDAAADTGMPTPTWGFAGSPLVLGDLAIVAASGRLVAYDAATGARRWLGPPAGGASYSSPHLATIGGVDQVLLLSATGLTSVDPRDGKILWLHPWKGYPIVQPALTPEGDVLISVNQDSGLRRISVGRGPTGWTTAERWTSNGLKPYFNDFVVHEGYAYGIDGWLVACVDIATGERKWKGGRYGAGQVMLLADQGLLLVLGERGELVLVKAAPDQFTEVAKMSSPAVTGKTWNHPVLVADVLLVRNSEEMAAFRLPRATADGGAQSSRRLVD
jgi:outer membrane protein assembly factor BamB